MKNLPLKFLFIFITLCPLFSLSQETKDNLIIVKPGDTMNLYENIVALLKTEGYKLSAPDKKTGVVYTKFKSIGKYSNSLVYYEFRIAGGVVNVRGYSNFNHMTERALYKWGFEPAFDEMNRLAKLLGTVTYGREK